MSVYDSFACYYETLFYFNGQTNFVCGTKARSVYSSIFGPVNKTYTQNDDKKTKTYSKLRNPKIKSNAMKIASFSLFFLFFFFYTKNHIKTEMRERTKLGQHAYRHTFNMNFIIFYFCAIFFSP